MIVQVIKLVSCFDASFSHASRNGFFPFFSVYLDVCAGRAIAICSIGSPKGFVVYL